jgi:hypothetical protein
MAAVLDRRDLPHRVHSKIALALELVVGDDFDIVGLANLLEHPADDPSTRLRIVIEDEVGHFALLLFGTKGELLLLKRLLKHLEHDLE